MAVSKDDIKTVYPLPVYNYRVEIGSDAVAFSEVSGLSIGYETTTYKESPVESGKPGPRVMRMPAQASDTTITLRKGVVPAVSIKVLYDWLKGVQTNQIDKKDISVSLCNESGEAVISWKVINAFPTKLEAPSFDANSNDAAIESMELTADGIVISEA
jgi:phage tail-like protein